MIGVNQRKKGRLWTDYPEILIKKVGVVTLLMRMIEVLKSQACLLVKAAYYYNQLYKAYCRITESIALLKTTKADESIIKALDAVAGKLLARRLPYSFLITSRFNHIAKQHGIELEYPIKFLSSSDLKRGYIILNSVEEEWKAGDIIYFLTNGTTLLVTEKMVYEKKESDDHSYVVPEINALEYHNIVRSK